MDEVRLATAGGVYLLKHRPLPWLSQNAEEKLTHSTHTTSTHFLIFSDFLRWGGVLSTVQAKSIFC